MKWNGNAIIVWWLMIIGLQINLSESKNKKRNFSIWSQFHNSLKHQRISNQINPLLWDKIKTIAKYSVETDIHNKTRKLRKKFNGSWQGSKFKKQKAPIDIIKVILNILDYKMTETEKTALCKGSNFAIATRQISIVEIITGFETTSDKTWRWWCQRNSTSKNSPIKPVTKTKLDKCRISSHQKFKKQRKTNHSQSEQGKCHSNHEYKRL